MTTPAYQRAWRLANKEKWKASQITYKTKNRKPCLVCKKPIDFPSPGRKYCLLCSPKQPLERGREFRTRRFAELAKYKLTKGCSICGYQKCASALHFHHLDPNIKEHRVWVPRGNEYEKCLLVCSNCHFELHEKDKAILKNGDIFDDKDLA